MLASAKVLPASFHAPGEMVGENELPWGSEKVLVHSITINDGGEHAGSCQMSTAHKTRLSSDARPILQIVTLFTEPARASCD
jgi:hypothetical protein